MKNYLSIAYNEPPDPPLQGKDGLWVAQLLNNFLDEPPVTNGTVNS